MTPTESIPISDVVDRTAIDSTGDKIGTIFDVYLDNDTDQPDWFAINTGMFGTKVSFVPVAGATRSGDDVMVAHDKATVKGAPTAEADGALSQDEEQALYAYYNRQGATRTAPSSSGTTDDAMTRSEEELDVNTTTKETGKARIRKWVETEDVHIVVPVRTEKARMVTEPVTDANRGSADGSEISEDEQVVTLSEETVDVSKHVVAKERVRLETDVETHDEVVDDTVRKERVAMDDTNVDPPKR